uniref:Uncharacterized protein n=1 Tax=Oryza sativa subsp. japonica TaxID=39947 RepID=Q69RL0_ORYSJ|nr:hypothetical protein [Oryza sativa Japonica Group]
MAGIRFSNPASLSSPSPPRRSAIPNSPGHVRPSLSLFKLPRRSLSLFPLFASLSRAPHRSRAVRPSAAAFPATPAASSRRYTRRRTAPSPPLGSRGRGPPRPPLLRRDSPPEPHPRRALVSDAMAAAFGWRPRPLALSSLPLTPLLLFVRRFRSSSRRRHRPPSPAVVDRCR